MQNLNGCIDQTILKPEAIRDDIEKFIRDVKEHNFYAAVVNPCWIELIHRELPAGIKRCSVVGFPLGASSTIIKARAAQDLVSIGCDEIDMVMNIGYFKSKDYDFVIQDIKAVVDSAQGRIVKVIIETCLLSAAEKKDAALLIVESGAHFVKTSTGFNRAGAVLEDVELLRKAVGQDFGVKASGGIRDRDQAIAMIKAGANRIGTSAGVSILEKK
jgi:deoxyribose-phosphate aldolase